jgi:hypothetical protein
MTLRELFEVTLTDSGQFLFGVENIEMNEDNFLKLTRKCLDMYNDHEPIDRRFGLQVSSTFYTFPGNEWEIPTWVAELIPVVISGLPWYFQNWMTWQGKGFGDEFNPLSCIWKYNRPTLYIEYVGTFTLWAAYERPYPRVGSVSSVSILQAGSSYNVNDLLTLVGRSSSVGSAYFQVGGDNGATVRVTGVNGTGGVTSVDVSSSGTGYWQNTNYSTTVSPVGGSSCQLTVTGLLTSPVPYYDIPHITSRDHRFLKLVQGRFMQALGRSRKAFILNDLPITSDAPEMVSTGKEIEKEAIDEMNESGKWYMAQS